MSRSMKKRADIRDIVAINPPNYAKRCRPNENFPLESPSDIYIMKIILCKISYKK